MRITSIRPTWIEAGQLAACDTGQRIGGTKNIAARMLHDFANLAMCTQLVFVFHAGWHRCPR
jgi:hypothetical protein